MRGTLRVANASGYWGDDPGALAGQVRGGALDYVTLDFLAAFTFLRSALDAERVRRYFGDLCAGPVERYELPGLRALNFLLRHALGGGGTLSLRADHQGKTLAQALLSLEIEVPASVLASTADEGEG